MLVHAFARKMRAFPVKVMGKATGFIEYTRSLPVLRSPRERVKDWREFHCHDSEELLREQGARCMDCGIPFCHTGQIIAGAASGCPINNLIPEWNDLVYRGRWQEALQRLLLTNNFPEFTGRVCPAPCEGSCVLGINDSPVTIKSIEESIIEKGFAENWIKPEPPVYRTEKCVAVIGSGPAGLACADQLNKAGHWVTVFERADRIGGLLMYGIPNMKLDKEIVQRRVDLMEREGVVFKTNINVGFDITVEELKENFDAMVLCCGATKARDLDIKGRELKGIHLAMEFLHANTKSLLNSNHADNNYISVKDKDVIVIGGGDTGTDCVATSLRHECKSLVQFEILQRPPDERASDNPWPQYPKVYKMDYGQEEAADIFGKDPREYSISTKRFVDGGNGNLAGVETVGIEWVKDEHGRFALREIEGTEKFWNAQAVFLALGFVGAESEGLLEQLGVVISERGNVAVDEKKMTNIESVFAAGDVERGQSLVVWAIADGRAAAKNVDEYLETLSGNKATGCVVVA